MPRIGAGWRAALPWLLVIMLGACATRPPAEPPSGTTPGGATPLGWYGRFAVSSVESGAQAREERASGRFLLRREAGGAMIEISSPLGQTIAVARTNAFGARLETSRGEVFMAPSAEALLEQAFGWRIPVSQLPDWLEGRFARPLEYAPDDPQRAVATVADGWRVRIEEFRDARPRRLALHWPDGPEAGARRLALVLLIDGREER